VPRLIEREGLLSRLEDAARVGVDEIIAVADTVLVRPDPESVTT